nr:hypothetical protein [uncultured Brevundimonas sp.]
MRIHTAVIDNPTPLGSVHGVKPEGQSYAEDIRSYVRFRASGHIGAEHQTPACEGDLKGRRIFGDGHEQRLGRYKLKVVRRYEHLMQQRPGRSGCRFGGAPEPIT